MLNDFDWKALEFDVMLDHPQLTTDALLEVIHHQFMLLEEKAQRTGVGMIQIAETISLISKFCQVFTALARKEHEGKLWIQGQYSYKDELVMKKQVIRSNGDRPSILTYVPCWREKND